MEFTEMGSTWHVTFGNYRLKGFKNTLCLESALGYWGLCTYNWRENLMIYRVCPEKAGTVWHDEVTTVFVAEIDVIECVSVDEFFDVTTPEYTIYQMISNKCHEFHLCEAIDMIYNWSSKSIVDIPKLEKMLKEHNLYDELLRLKEVALEQAEEG